jgi:hypothetical protein
LCLFYNKKCYNIVVTKKRSPLVTTEFRDRPSINISHQNANTKTGTTGSTNTIEGLRGENDRGRNQKYSRLYDGEIRRTRNCNPQLFPSTSRDDLTGGYDEFKNERQIGSVLDAENSS